MAVKSRSDNLQQPVWVTLTPKLMLCTVIAAAACTTQPTLSGSSSASEKLSGQDRDVAAAVSLGVGWVSVVADAERPDTAETGELQAL